ncbi:transcription termination/antitermination protein NusG [Sphingomonas sp. HT-1]|uniref:transcription termination/antitermination protein NusG n=1 Tax=unclassified Sphingomonas TaxID=196159 RepID=UPI0013654E85|nr:MULTISPECIES: transcription termination/antitermination NusG family protein [unclassified Sphingomonas]
MEEAQMIETKWCIVRTSPGRTISVVRSLEQIGIEAWTPIDVIKQRVPRSHKTFSREIPIMPTFVFVRARHLGELLGICASPVSGHPPFSVFRHAGRFPFIADADVVSVRLAEERKLKARLRTTKKEFEPGAMVKVPDGPFAGMNGIVEEGNGRFALVAFGGSFRVRVASFLLVEDAIQNGNTPTGTAAIAA